MSVASLQKFYEQFSKRENASVMQIVQEEREGKFFFYISSPEKFDTSLLIACLEKYLPFLTNVVQSPYVILKSEYELVRTERAGNMTPQAIRKTVRDTTLWKKHGEKMRPEYVYSATNEDEYATYENRVVRTLIDKAVRFLDLPAECAREGVKNLYEAYFQSSSLNKLDLVRLFDEDLFKDSNPESFADYSKLYQLRGKLTQLRNSHFYKILSRAPAFTGVPEATNLFVHSPDYNGCFKLWRSLDEFYAGLSLLSSAQQRSVYSAFVTLAMISCYVRLGFAPVRDVPVGNTDKNFSLKDFCLKNEDFNVVLNADEEKITVLVQCAKARSQQTTVIRLRTDLSEEDVSDNAFTVSLHRTEYSDRAVCVTPGNKNSLKDLEALVRCSVLTFGADKSIYDKVCLVCGSNLLEDKGRAFRCPDCGAVYTFLGKDKVWLNQFNALSDMEKK